MSEMTIIPDLYLKGDSKQWNNWQAIYLDIKTCEDCRKKHGKIPCAPGRTWFEADIDYTYGKRNLKRILYSNDGLVFVSEDHYQTFYEITK